MSRPNRLSVKFAARERYTYGQYLVFMVQEVLDEKENGHYYENDGLLTCLCYFRDISSNLLRR
jgi:hypothetical protein